MKKLPLIFLALAITLTGCGIPSQKYGASKSEGVYFTVPYSWYEIPTTSLNAEEKKNGDNLERAFQVKWQLAYSKSRDIRPGDVFNLATPEVPIVYARVRELFPAEINSINYNEMRNVVVPVTKWLEASDKNSNNINLLDDYDRIEVGARGIRTIFTYDYKGIASYIDQTVLLTPDRSKLYMFIVRCSVACQKKYKEEMTKIGDSFTVRGSK